MNDIESDIEKLRSRAIALGASRSKAIKADKVVVDPRVRFKCQVPMCDSYGRNRMCPPSTIPVDEFAKILSRYTYGLLVQVEMAYGEEEIKASFKGKNIQALHKETEYVDEMTGTMRHMSELLSSLEKEALYMGYRFAASLTGGCCRLCDECVGPDSRTACRHPFLARPSMEAVGIDVVATAENAGLPLEFPVKGKAIWTGLLLLD